MTTYTAYLYENIGYAALNIPMEGLVRDENGEPLTATYEASTLKEAKAYFKHLPGPKLGQRWHLNSSSAG